MKYDQKALYAELTHFYLSICEKEQVDEPRIRGLVGSLVRKARQAIPSTLAAILWRLGLSLRCG